MPWNLKDRDGEDVTDREGFGGLAGAAAGYGLGIALIPASAGLLGLGAVCGALTVNQCVNGNVPPIQNRTLGRLGGWVGLVGGKSGK